MNDDYKKLVDIDTELFNLSEEDGQYDKLCNLGSEILSKYYIKYIDFMINLYKDKECDYGYFISKQRYNEIFNIIESTYIDITNWSIDDKYVYFTLDFDAIKSLYLPLDILFDIENRAEEFFFNTMTLERERLSKRFDIIERMYNEISEELENIQNIF